MLRCLRCGSSRSVFAYGCHRVDATGASDSAASGGRVGQSWASCSMAAKKKRKKRGIHVRKEEQPFPVFCFTWRASRKAHAYCRFAYVLEVEKGMICHAVVCV